MSRALGVSTSVGLSMFRCLAVGLSAEQQAGCREAIAPIEVVLAADVEEACASMSSVLPLVVVFDERLSEDGRSELREFATACGAELVTIASTFGDALAVRLLDALRIAELRRLGARR